MTNKQFRSKKTYICIAVIAYFVIAVILAGATMTMIYNEHRATLRDIALECADEAADGVPVEDIDTHSFGLVAYSPTGDSIFDAMAMHPHLDGSAFELYDPIIHKYLPTVLGGELSEHLIFVPSERLFSMFVAVPVVKGGQIKGAFFLIRNIQAMLSSVIVAVVAYTILYIIFVSLFISIQERKRRYIESQQIYVANMSHDLKSPITSIRALAETMYEQMPANTDDQKRYCGFIISESVKLERTIQDILELSALQTNNKMFEKSQVELFEAFGPTIEKYRTLCYDLMIDFNVNVDFSALPSVHTNPESMARVLDIILDNAVKFVSSETGRIEINASKESKNISVRISDNGIGMDKETQSHIFERFYMGERAHNTKGSGLGLAIVQEIITGLGEKISVESAPNQGTTFTFTIQL